MKFDKFTMKAQEALASAQQLAMAKSNTFVSAIHLLSVLLEDAEGVVVLILILSLAGFAGLKLRLDTIPRAQVPGASIR